ncbi:hypothetical protein SDC9_90453 [bioreactor metagenome]|uniref:NAD-specific glutamate dehydrogenase n=1 Tax=bioreactor metagenome TaxID=1076179 RepID=A0A644ZSP9_9ZZZZ
MRDLHAHMVAHAGVLERFVDRLVGVGQLHVLAHHGDLDFALGMLGLIDQVVPALEVGGRRVQAQLVADQAVQALLVEHARHLVDGVHVPHGDHAPLGHIGEEGDLALFLFGHLVLGAAQQRIGLDTDFAQLLHRVLGGLGLELARCLDIGQVGQVHEGRVVRAELQRELAHGFQERQGFDVAHGAANFADGDIDRIVGADAGAAFDVFLNLVGDVGNDLHGLAQIVTTAFLLQHGLVDAPGGEVVGLLHARFDETLVVTEVEVGFCPVVRHEHFAVLERRHRARVHVDIGVQLDESDFEAARFQNRSKGG